MQTKAKPVSNSNDFCCFDCKADENGVIRLCKLHAAAQELLEAAKAAVDHKCHSFECGETFEDCPVLQYLKDAIVKTEEK